MITPNDCFSRIVGETAVKALMYELAVTPKPGLVDRQNNGSHKDMDFFTFIDSGFTLFGYFSEITQKSVNFKGPANRLLAQLRESGMLAEKQMLEVTGGANTHKGAVFSLGLLCASTGYLKGKLLEISPESILKTAAEIAGNLENELETNKPETHGEKVYKRYGITGIRGEASRGFPTVQRYGYPVLEEYINRGYSANNAGVATLLSLMTELDDTNIITRSDIKTLKNMQNKAEEILKTSACAEDLITNAKKLDEELIALGISPGGCADLLAMSFFIHFIMLCETYTKY